MILVFTITFKINIKTVLNDILRIMLDFNGTIYKKRQSEFLVF